MNTSLQNLVERIQKEEDPFSKAKLLNTLKKEKQISLRSISAQVKLKPSYMSHILRLLKLPPLIVDGYYSQLVTLSHLFILSRLTDEKEMISLYEKVLADDLTSQQTEQLVREVLYGLKNEGEYLRKQEVEEFLGAIKAEDRKAKIIQTRTRGKFILELEGNLIKTTKQLKRLMSILKDFTREEIQTEKSAHVEE